MEVEVYKKSEVSKGLLQDDFDKPIHYASGPRAHTSRDATREEQRLKIQHEKEISEQVILTQPKIDQMLKVAFENGREEAMAEAVTSNNERFVEMEGKLKTLLLDLSEQEQSRAAELEKAALRLSLDISRKVIDHAVEINPEYIVEIIRDALSLSGGARVKKVKVSPQDMEFIEVLKVAQSIREFDGSWNFEADETIKAGCILESSAGSIDLQVDKAWERIRDKVLSLRK